MDGWEAGGGGGVGSRLTFDDESKSERLLSLRSRSEIEIRVNENKVQLLMRSPNLLKSRIPYMGGWVGGWWGGGVGSRLTFDDESKSERLLSLRSRSEIEIRVNENKVQFHRN